MTKTTDFVECGVTGERGSLHAVARRFPPLRPAPARSVTAKNRVPAAPAPSRPESAAAAAATHSISGVTSSRRRRKPAISRPRPDVTTVCTLGRVRSGLVLGPVKLLS